MEVNDIHFKPTDSSFPPSAFSDVGSAQQSGLHCLKLTKVAPRNTHSFTLYKTLIITLPYKFSHGRVYERYQNIVKRLLMTQEGLLTLIITIQHRN